MVQLWAELLAGLPELDVGGDFSAQAVRDRLDLDIPDEGASNDELIRRLRELVFDGSIYPGHPGFLAYVSGSGTVPGAAADLIASALNQNLGGFRLSPGANQVEAAVIGWLADSFGLPDSAGGQVVAGGAMANFVGLKVTRDRALGPAGRAAHVVQSRAADMLGLGADAVRSIPVDDRQRIMVASQSDGRVFVSNAVVNGRFCLRACIVNFRTEAEHLERVLAVAEELGRAAPDA